MNIVGVQRLLELERYDWKGCDSVFDAAEMANQTVRGHNLCTCDAYAPGAGHALKAVQAEPCLALARALACALARASACVLPRGLAVSGAVSCADSGAGSCAASCADSCTVSSCTASCAGSCGACVPTTHRPSADTTLTVR